MRAKAEGEGEGDAGEGESLSMKGAKQGKPKTKRHRQHGLWLPSWLGRHGSLCIFPLLLAAGCAAGLGLGFLSLPVAQAQENVWKGTAIKRLRVPEVKLSGLARACAGGIGDAVHTIELQVQTTQKSLDGSPGEPMKEVKLLFYLENNKGHDYGDGRETKKAKFVKGGEITADGEEMKVSTDAQGKATIEIRSSDIVSQDIKLKVRWLLQAPPSSSGGAQEVDIEVPLYHNDAPVEAVACDFGEAVSYRRFANHIDPDEPEDNGWLFDQQWLEPNIETTAKVYMKFMKDPSVGDVDGNWEEVNGHLIRIYIDSVDVSSDSSGTATGQDDYALIVPNQPDGTAIHATAGDGAATAVLRAGPNVDDADTIWVSGTNLSQWDN